VAISSEDDTEIRDLLARYCLYLDLEDVEAWIALFTEAAEYHVSGAPRSCAARATTTNCSARTQAGASRLAAVASSRATVSPIAPIEHGGHRRRR